MGKKKSFARLLRNSFRSFTGLRKSLDVSTVNLLMGYDLDERSQKLSYISEPKWKERCKGQLFYFSQDIMLQNNWLARKDYCKILLAP